jgi:hypothetical protein
VKSHGRHWTRASELGKSFQTGADDGPFRDRAALALSQDPTRARTWRLPSCYDGYGIAS